jgi:MFS family permease
VFGAGDAGIGLLFAARGFGALIGPFLARSIITMDDRGLLRGIAGSFAVVVACYAIFPVAPTIWLAALLVFGAHLGGGSQWTLSTYGLQRSTPDAFRGRIFSFDYGLVTMTIAVSTLLAGLLADLVPARVAVWTMAGLIFAAGATWIAFAWPVLARGRATLEDR